MIRLPSIGLPATAAAAVHPGALRAMEQGALAAVNRMLGSVKKLGRSLQVRKPLPRPLLTKANRRLTFLQVQTDGLFQSVDLFMDALASRADTEIGLLLAGVDQLVADALNRPVSGYDPPKGVTYLDSATRGGAITRARTTLPGGIILPVAMIRVSPETLPTRLTSTLHEAGHQLSVDLNIMDEAEQLIFSTVREAIGSNAEAKLWSLWTSELLADIWAFALGAGAPAVDGLQRVLSLPEQLLYMIRGTDPHPPGAVRVPFALAASQLLHADPVLTNLAKRHSDVYGRPDIPAEDKQRIDVLASAAPPVAETLISHPFKGFGGKSIAQVCETKALNASRIRSALSKKSTLNPRELARNKPLTALATIGYARLLRMLSARQLDELARAWLQELARNEFLMIKS